MVYNEKDVITISGKIQKDTECSSEKSHSSKNKLKELILILTLGYVSFTSYSCYSLLAPIFPREAEKRSLTPSQYGFIFAVYEVVRLVMSPACSAISIKMTPKVFLMTGIFIKSFCTLLFGLVSYTTTANSFFFCSLIVRIVWAIGGSATTLGCYLVGTILFPKNIAQVFAAIEMGTGIGQMAGPGLGGFLYELGNTHFPSGGYQFPFYSMSLLCAISLIPAGFLIKGDCKPIPVEEKVEKTTLMQTIRLEGVYINLIASAAVCSIFGYNEATLDFHIREIGNYSAAQTGGIFLLSALFYSLSTQFLGYLAKTNEKSYRYLLCGCALCIISCVIIGPLPFIPFSPSIYFVIFSQILGGCSFGFIFVLCFDDTVKEAIKHLPNTDSTMAAISGLFTSSFALGNIVGPIAGTYMIDHVGYRNSTIPNVLVLILLTILLIFYMIRNKKF